MADYRSMYFKLSGKVADTIEQLDAISAGLKIAQQEAEEAYISSDETPIKLFGEEEQPDKDDE